MNNPICVPEWEIEYTDSLATIYEEHALVVLQVYHLQPWESRSDVPGWAREIAIIAAIHSQHWTGYIFNDYEQIIKNIEYLCSKIESKRILVYIPGWEGRYYRKGLLKK